MSVCLSAFVLPLGIDNFFKGGVGVWCGVGAHRAVASIGDVYVCVAVRVCPLSFKWNNSGNGIILGISTIKMGMDMKTKVDP